MYLQDSSNKDWVAQYFVITDKKLCYIEKPAESIRNESTVKTDFNGPRSDELHFTEMWFHGRLVNGRARAEEVLLANRHLGDGTFLVRESDTYPGDYTLSFL